MNDRIIALARYLRRPEGEILARLKRVSPEEIEFEVYVDLPQRPLYCVREWEPVRVVSKSESEMPCVYAVRNDFPRVPHLALNLEEFPRQLCLFDRPWAEESGDWTPQSFVERIRNWFSGTADGTLHTRDQPLEPLILGPAPRLVLPAVLKPDGHNCWSQSFYLEISGSLKNNDFTIIAWTNLPAHCHANRFPITFVECPATEHGIIHRSPTTLLDLNEILNDHGIPFLDTICKELDYALGQIKKDGLQDQPLIIVVRLPKCRFKGGPIEKIEEVGFLLGTSPKELFATEIQHELDVIYVPRAVKKISDPNFIRKIPIEPMLVRRSLDPKTSALFNGRKFSDNKIVAIGVGSLGSLIVNNLARAGFGIWTLIDEDVFEPHNAARHLLTSLSIGRNKAPAVAEFIHSIFPDLPAPESISCSLISPNRQTENVSTSLSNADLVLDLAASVAVQRHLANDKTIRARCMSVFLNPTGEQLVILAEPPDRAISLFWLEALYMQAVAHSRDLTDHFDHSSIPKHRYGNACRDLSSVLSFEEVSMHAAIAAQRLRQIETGNSPACEVFILDRETCTVKNVKINVLVPVRLLPGEWTFLIHPGVLETMRSFRTNATPNETGGILLGLIDRISRSVAVLEALPAPPDSIARPDLFVRGKFGLEAKVKSYSEKTLGNVRYLGEWHTHPGAITANASEQDFAAIKKNASAIDAEGLPAIMLIASETSVNLLVKHDSLSETFQSTHMFV